MNGNRYLLDTNAIVALLSGNDLLRKTLASAEWIGISVISRIEFLAFPGLDDHDAELFREFLRRIDVIGSNENNDDLIDGIIDLKKSMGIKLPDAVVYSLITEDYGIKHPCASG